MSQGKAGLKARRVKQVRFGCRVWSAQVVHGLDINIKSTK